MPCITPLGCHSSDKCPRMRRHTQTARREPGARREGGVEKVVWHRDQPRGADATKAGRRQEQPPEPPDGARPRWIWGSSPAREETWAVLRHLVCGDSLQQPREMRAVVNCHNLAPTTGLPPVVSPPSRWLPFLPAAQASTPGCFPLSLTSLSAIRKLSGPHLESMAPESACPSHPGFHVPDGRRALPLVTRSPARPLLTDVFSFTPRQPPRCPSNTPGPLHRPFRVLDHGSPDSRVSPRLSSLRCLLKGHFLGMFSLWTHSKHQHLP